MKQIHELNLDEWRGWMQEHGMPAYRAGQLYEWLWKRSVTDVQDMRNLPQTLRDLLSQEFRMEHVSVSEKCESGDGSVKFAVRLDDGRQVETVLIPSRNRSTVCVSSQVGCPLNCRFCATAHLGFARNLTAYEMYAQVFMANQESLERFGHPLSNLVWMGMGEPLLDFEAVKAAIGRVTASDGLGFSPSRITVSTAGLADGILRLADELPSVNLAVSLHTADDVQRRELMPVAKRYPLTRLSEALSEYHKRTGNRITIEYMLLKGVNDSPHHVDLLLQFCKKFPVKINIIEYNPHPYAPYAPSEAAVETAFVRRLEEKNLIVNIRRSKGRDIAAACGQLANRKKKSV